MKTTLILLFLSLSSFTYADAIIFGYGDRPPLPENPCNIDSYKDFINKLGVHLCNLQDVDLSDEMLSEANLKGADLRNADLSNTDLSNADLRYAWLYTHTESKSMTITGKFTRSILIDMGIMEEYSNEVNLQYADLSGAKVTKEQAKYLSAKGFSGFVIVE